MNEQNHHLPAPGGPHEDAATGVSYLAPRGAARDQRAIRSLDEVSRRAAVVIDERNNRRSVSETVRQLRRHGVPGYRTDVIPAADVDALGDHPYELVHVAAGEAAASAAISHSGERGVPVVASGDMPDRGGHLRDCALVLSPTRAADATLAELGVPRSRIARWQPGIDREVFGPAHYSAAAIPAATQAAEGRQFNVLCSGPLEDDRGLWLVVQAFLAAHERDPRLQLVLLGCGSEHTALSGALGATVTLLDITDPEQLAQVYASADLFVSPASADGFGEGVLEAQASGLPVVAIDGSGSGELVESGRSGCLVAPDADTLGDAIRCLARRATLRERLVTGGLLAARERTWERSLMELAIGWERAVSLVASEVTRAA
jgi:glycosyltransferase involved in cell wall biosynthesis